MGAPMCTLKPTVPAPSAPTVYAANIPPATPDNLIEVVNALRAALIGTQTGAGAGTAIGGGGNTFSGNGNNVNSFKVVQQITQDIKVYDPNDSSGQTFVTVRQITGLTLQNPYDGSTWSWSQSGGVPGSGS